MTENEPKRVLVTDAELDALSDHESSNYQRQIRHRIRTRYRSRLDWELAMLDDCAPEIADEIRDVVTDDDNSVTSEEIINALERIEDKL
jgi:hypothetical protein